MPTNSDYRQTVTLALQAQGADALTIVRDGIAAVEAEMAVLNQMQAEGLGPREYIAKLNSLGAELGKLQKMELGLTQTLEAETRTRIDLIAREERARMEAAEAARTAAGEALRARIDAYAREERALESLRSQLSRNAELRDKEAQAEAFMTRQTVELAAAMEGLAESERKAATYSFFANPQGNAIGKTAREVDDLTQSMLASTRTTQVASGGLVGFAQNLRGFGSTAGSAAKSMDGYNSAGDRMTATNKQGAYALLNIAHAAQDAQYGFAAVLNNIPLIVAGMGGSAGLSGAVLLAGVGINVFSDHLTAMGRKLGYLSDPLKDARNDVAGLASQIEALNAKPFKLADDYKAIERLEDRLRSLTKATKEYDALKDRDPKKTKDAKEILGEGIAEGGGASNLEKAIIEIKRRDGTYTADSLLHGDIDNNKRMLAEVMRNQKAVGKDSYLGLMMDYGIDYFRGEIARLEKEMNDEAKGKIAEMVGMVHGEGSRKSLEGLINDPRNEAIFQNHGVDLDYLGAHVANASPDAMREVEARKVRVAREKAEKAKAESAEVERIRHDQEMADKNRRFFEKLDDIGEAADRKAAAERKKKVDQVDQAFTGTAAGMFARNDILLNRGAPVARSTRQEKLYQAEGRDYALPPDVLAGRVDRRIASDLRRTGNDPGLAPDIRLKAADLYRQKTTEALGRTPIQDPTAMADAVGRKQAEANAAQVQANAALMQVLQGFMAQASQQEAALMRQAAQAAGMNQNLRRNQQQRRTLGRIN